MNFQLPADLSLAFNAAFAKTAFYISLTILIAVLVDHLFRSFIKVPKHFDNRRTRSVAMLIKSVITAVVWAIAIYTIFTLMGINITPLLASASIVGVVIGIGGRQIIEDLLTGIFLLSQDSIAFGDYIKIDEMTEGNVEHIGYRTIKIRSLDGSLHIIPNGQIKKVINYSRHKSNVLIKIGVKNDQDIAKVLKSANESLKLLRQDEEFGALITLESRVDGIDEMQALGIMTVLVTIVTQPGVRLEVGRKYRYLVKKQFEKDKIKLA